MQKPLVAVIADTQWHSLLSSALSTNLWTEIGSIYLQRLLDQKSFPYGSQHFSYFLVNTASIWCQSLGT